MFSRTRPHGRPHRMTAQRRSRPGSLRFRDRREAGRRLAERLAPLREARPVVLALPRGGVPVGYEIARALGADLDVLLVRKIGAPGEPELGLGAVVDGRHPHRVLNQDVLRLVQPDEAYLEQETKQQLAELERRRRLYQGDEPPVVVRRRTVVIVDDGIATGGTMKAALAGVGREAPARLILAVPVAAAAILAELAPLVDEIVCLEAATRFGSVGHYYFDFTQTTDAEVIRLLADARREKSAAQAGTGAAPRRL